MNEFLDQFLLEAGELVEQATRDLLALEAAPGDKDRLDGVFRAFHTLKGAAGIVDFAAMARALHAVEDVLATVRAGAHPVTPHLIGACLACLDQVSEWLDAMRTAGEAPGDAEAGADAIVRHIVEAAGSGKTAGTPPDGAPGGWLDGLLARHPAAVARAATALRYAPDAHCFFRGEDPLALVASLPGVAAVEVAPAAPWPPLEEFDPFACRVVVLALVAGPREAAAAALRQVRDHVEIRSLPRAGQGREAEAGLSPPARDLLEAQLLLLAEDDAEGAPGRRASAARVAANVLRHAGREPEASRIEEALAGSGTQTAAEGPRRLAAAIESVLDDSAPTGPAEAREPARPETRETAPRTLRIDVERIDALVGLTGELTVAKNAVGYTARLAQDGADPNALAAALKDQHALLDRLVGELQRSVLNIRVLPLRHAFQRFPRLVREMAASLGKPVRLVTEGDVTEADKAIVEALSEPLLHVLRNAVDHGIEGAEERAGRGKPPTATVRLRAARDGEHVLVEVEDDGRGIDLARVRAVAAEHGVASGQALAAMSDEEAANLVFAPGFSTAAEVTGLSGRGVGMDAVRAAVERMGGRVAVESRPGQGTLVRFTLPFTVMMTRVMTVEAGGQVFGIPLDAVLETVRLPRDRIVPVGAAHAFVLRDRTIPLIDLAGVLAGTGATAAAPEANVVVAALDGQFAGIEVDRLGERLDVMLKPMDGLLAGMPGLSGTTLLGDGRVLLVLDLRELLA